MNHDPRCPEVSRRDPPTSSAIAPSWSCVVQEPQLLRVPASGGSDGVVHVVLIVRRHPAVGVGDDHDPADPGRCTGRAPASAARLGHRAPALRMDLRVTGAQPEHPQRGRCASHARDDGQLAARPALPLARLIRRACFRCRPHSAKVSSSRVRTRP